MQVDLVQFLLKNPMAFFTEIEKKFKICTGYQKTFDNLNSLEKEEQSCVNVP